MTAPAPPPPPAEAVLIRRAREAAGLSPETAAARMAASAIGASRWRQLEAGHRARSTKPEIARAPTLAHMALAVGLTPERLEEAGRTDAAAIMREVARKEDKRNPPSAPPTAHATPRVDERWRLLQGTLSLAGEGLTPAEYRELVQRIETYLQSHPEWQPPGTVAPPEVQPAGQGDDTQGNGSITMAEKPSA